MGRYIVKRILEIIPVLFIITFIVFFLVRVSGDPVNTMLPPEATPEDRQELREALGLNKPYLEQYGIFLSDLVPGRFGISLRYGQEATEVVMEKLPATLQLATLSLLVSTVLGVVLGVLCARTKDTVLDVFVNGLAVVGQAMPSFWIGIMLILLFGVILQWLPVSGPGDWKNLVLPVSTLSIVTAAQIIPLVRSSMLEIMHEDYIRTARSKGLKERVIVYKHAFKNALIPVVTILALQVPNLIGGSLDYGDCVCLAGTGAASDPVYQRQGYVRCAGMCGFHLTDHDRSQFGGRYSVCTDRPAYPLLTGGTT